MNRIGKCGWALGALLLFNCGCDFNFGRSGLFTPPPPEPNRIDPPVRVARLSYIEGTVWFRPAGSTEWTPAVLNRPITTGDELWVDGGSRAELHLGFAAIRLDRRTDIGILELSDTAFQVALTQGVVEVNVHRLENGTAFEIDTPIASVTPSDTGQYRIEADSKTNSTEVIVRSGEMEVTNPKRAFEVAPGQWAHINREPIMRRDINPAPPPDDFYQFCQLRDRREERSESKKHVAPGVIGSYDLDDYGIWMTNAALGDYWIPRYVGEGWAPYRFGRWAWIEPWGWTWIDDAPWGFAPSHYGRWAWLDGGWAWLPGKSRVAPAFVPALVVFAGEGRPGSHFSDWIGKTGVAWLPLAPQEVYAPVYRSSQSYLLAINTPVDNLRAIDPAAFARQPFVNRLVRDAITAVLRDTLTSGQPIGGCTVRVDARDAAVMKGTGASPRLVPAIKSLSTPAPRGVRVTEPPVQESTRPVVLRRSPPPAPIPFDLRLPLLEAHPGQPPDHESLEQLRRGRQPVTEER